LTAEHVTGKFCAVGKKELQKVWLENFCAEGKNCRTRDWKILVPREKTAEHMAGKCWCRRKKKLKNM